MQDRQQLGCADRRSEPALLERASPRPNPRWRGVRSPPRADREPAAPPETPAPNEHDGADQSALDRIVITTRDAAVRR